MDFVMGLPKTSKRFDTILVTIDILTKSTHFLPIQTTYLLDRLAQLYVDEIVQLHRVPVSIMSNRDPRFASRFWSGLQQAIGTKLYFIMFFHPQIDRQFERTIQILKDIMRVCVIYLKGSLDAHL